MTMQPVVQFYKDLAPNSDAIVMGEKMNYQEPAAACTMIRKGLKPHYRTFLDLGIGTGLVSEMLADCRFDIYGVDLSEDMIEECRNKGIAKELRVHDLSDGSIPFPGVKFDVVCAVSFLEFLPDIGPLFRSIHNVLDDSGFYCFSYGIHEINDEMRIGTLNGELIWQNLYEQRGVIWRLLPAETVTAHIDRSGFRVVDSESMTAFRSHTTGDVVKKTVFRVEKA